MKLKKELDLITVITSLFIIFAGIFAFFQGKIEFFGWSVILLFIFLSLVHFRKKLHLTVWILIGVSVLLLMHFLGGLIHISGAPLYNFSFGFFRYDNIAHAFGSVIMVILTYNFLSSYLSRKAKEYKPLRLAIILILFTLGLGAANEIFEFGAVMTLSSTNVGDYYNNMLDLIYNFIGAAIGSVLIIYYHLIYVIRKK